MVIFYCSIKPKFYLNFFKMAELKRYVQKCFMTSTALFYRHNFAHIRIYFNFIHSRCDRFQFKNLAKTALVVYSSFNEFLSYRLVY